MEPAGHYWGLLAEQCERRGLPYVLVHPLSVAREREITRYNREKTDPRDAELIAALAAEGKITDTGLPKTHARATLWDLAHDYFLIRKHSAAERTRLGNYWHRLLPEFFDLFHEVTGDTALAVSCALGPLSELVTLTPEEWTDRVRSAYLGCHLMTSRVRQLLPLLQAAAKDPHRRTGEGLPWRIRHAAQRRHLLETQKAQLREEILAQYAHFEEAVYLDSIPGSDPFYNALTLALVGDFADYDDPRTLVKPAGTDINQFASGDYQGTSRISHRGRNFLRAAAYQQARRLVKHNPEFRRRYFNLLHRTDRHLTELQCYVAVMNSYLRMAHVLVTKRTLYRPPDQREEKTT